MNGLENMNFKVILEENRPCLDCFTMRVLMANLGRSIKYNPWKSVLGNKFVLTRQNVSCWSVFSVHGLISASRLQNFSQMIFKKVKNIVCSNFICCCLRTELSDEKSEEQVRAIEPDGKGLYSLLSCLSNNTTKDLIWSSKSRWGWLAVFANNWCCHPGDVTVEHTVDVTAQKFSCLHVRTVMKPS